MGMNKTELLNKWARDGEERVLLSRILDKLEAARNRSIPSYTPFLSPGERAAAEGLLAACGHPRHAFFGGFEGAERTVCGFAPDWMEPEDLFAGEDGPLTVVRMTFREGAGLSHRDFLGAVLGLGLTRQKMGDILVGQGSCDLILLKETAPILLSQLEQVGRWKVSCREAALTELEVEPPKVKVIRDTVATPRLDAVAASGFSLSRGKAAGLIESGRVAVNHREVLKPDRTVAEGDVISCKGMGKFVVKEASALSKKGRVMVVLERYV